jgi:hypothetical protein
LQSVRKVEEDAKKKQPAADFQHKIEEEEEEEE